MPTRRNVFRTMGIACVFFGAAHSVHATSSEIAIELCKTEMMETEEALEVRNLKVRRPEDKTFVYGDADFKDIERLHFRCRVHNDELQQIRYLVRDPDYVNGRAWAKDRPHPAKHEQFDLDEASMSAPPPIAPSPQFERVPD